MNGLLRALVLCLVGSLTLSGCTQEGSVTGGRIDARPETEKAATRDFVGDSSISLPSIWSYNVSRQGAGSWQFSLSPEPFNLGGRCDRNGPLASKLLARAGVFVTGFAYPSKFPPAAGEFEQNPGSFALDESTLANYEGFCHPTHRIDFTLEDIYVSMHVAVHKAAADSTIEQALEVLNTIR